eukprot:gene197-108_t
MSSVARSVPPSLSLRFTARRSGTCTSSQPFSLHFSTVHSLTSLYKFISYWVLPFGYDGKTPFKWSDAVVVCCMILLIIIIFDFFRLFQCSSTLCGTGSLTPLLFVFGVLLLLQDFSSLLSAINTKSVLPSFLEVCVPPQLDNSFCTFFHYAHSMLAERAEFLGSSVQYSNEIYYGLMILLQRQLLWTCDSSAFELLMGLVRAGVMEKSAARYVRYYGRDRFYLSPALFGPPPSVSPEERAMMQGGSGVPKVPRKKFSKVPRTDASATADASEEFMALTDDMSATQAMETDRSLYGHLHFRRLSTVQRVISLVLLTILPYVRRRMAMWYEQQVDETVDAVAARAVFEREHPTRAKLYAFLTKYLYPAYHVTYETSHFLFDLFYVLELTPYTSPIHRLFRIAVRRTKPGDFKYAGPGTQRALIMFQVIILALTFGTSHATATMPIPPPPKFAVDTNLPADATLPNPGECPVCRKEIVNGTVITAMPVTRQPASVQQLRRIIQD